MRESNRNNKTTLVSSTKKLEGQGRQKDSQIVEHPMIKMMCQEESLLLSTHRNNLENGGLTLPLLNFTSTSTFGFEALLSRTPWYTTSLPSNTALLIRVLWFLICCA